MRQDITYKYLKIMGIVFGAMFLMLLVVAPISNVRLNKILTENKIKIGRQLEFGKISKIDSASITYTFNFTLGERVCLTVDTEMERSAAMTVFKDGKIIRNNTCE